MQIEDQALITLEGVRSLAVEDVFFDCTFHRNDAGPAATNPRIASNKFGDRLGER
jgi:hypothetical protein